MGSFSWLTFGDAKAQLAARLADSNFVFWTNAECGIYIRTALKMFNVLTFTWRKEFVFNDPVNIWNSLGSLAGSPRLRTTTDTDCYIEMQYMTLEPPTGGVWTGTSQFNISDFADALQGSRDEMLQVSNCNQNLMTAIPLTPNTISTTLPDTTIDVARVRYIPLTGNPTTLYRDDTVAQEFYESPLYQQDSGTPQTFSLSSEPPLTWIVDIPPNQPGTYEAVVLQSGVPFNPPATALLGVPDDWAFVAQYGALAQLLGRDSEATDKPRAAYCQKMFQEGLNLMLKTPWIMLGKVNGQAVSLDSIYAMDRFDPNWDSNPPGFGPVIVVGGIDLIAAPQGQGIGLTVLANAPVPTLDSDFVQVSRSNADIVFDLAQARATFKCSGAEFQAALELEKGAIQACAAENSRLRSTGSFADILAQRGFQQERDVNRFNSKQKV